MDVGLDRLRREEGLAQPGEALVRMDAQPDEVRELVEADCLNGGDFHAAFASVARPALLAALVDWWRPNTQLEETKPRPATRRQPSPCGMAEFAEPKATANSGRGSHLGNRNSEVATPPRKSLPLRASDLSALPQAEGWGRVCCQLTARPDSDRISLGS